MYLSGSVEHVLLSEAQAVQVGFELLHVLFAHIGCPCCQRNGEEGERSDVLGLLCSWVIPIADGELTACPHLSPLCIRGKGAFCPAREDWRCPCPLFCPWGSICSPERLRLGKSMLMRFRISRSLSLWISLAMEATLLLSTGRYGEREIPPLVRIHPMLGLITFYPSDSSQWGPTVLPQTWCVVEEIFSPLLQT